MGRSVLQHMGAQGADENEKTQSGPKASECARIQAPTLKKKVAEFGELTGGEQCVSTFIRNKMCHKMKYFCINTILRKHSRSINAYRSLIDIDATEIFCSKD